MKNSTIPDNKVKGHIINTYFSLTQIEYLVHIAKLMEVPTDDKHQPYSRYR